MKKQDSRRARVQVIVWVVVVVLAVVAGGYLWYMRYTSANSKTPPHSLTTPSANPSPSTPNTPSSTSPQGQQSGAQCTTSNLSASLAPASSSAGTFHDTLSLTNISSGSCTVEGYPGVSLVSASGTQLGQPATRDSVTAVGLVTLAPNESAYSSVGVPDPGEFPAGECSAAASDMKVYPPNQTQALTAPSSAQYCPGFAVTALSAQLQ